ncbi:MAG: hypothetical protein Q4A84_10830 [Neisseria sp.]|uniref:hypothetical protein n=1 Tax=Neisseria sp. TaxID=192066 RepID=UPI0026DC50DE|nr:hypothetical protein [Neisseria sp.]MDO4642173.1 hypothetical protein [Neisseria sp.]
MNKAKFCLNVLKSTLHPYVYQGSRYLDSFISQTELSQEKGNGQVEKRVFVFWTGNNPMSANRLAGMKALEEKADVPILLITPDNLQEWIKPEAPLHPAYEYLSLVHKSDYLRCYFMHHWGGGYSDVKPCRFPWQSFFDDLDKSAAYLVGYCEKKAADLAQVSGKVMQDMENYFSRIVGNCAYICRPDTPFTREWYQELHRRMDAYAPALEAAPGNVMGDNEGYPIPWTNILGDIFHPLALKYSGRILRRNKLRPVCQNYR